MTLGLLGGLFGGGSVQAQGKVSVGRGDDDDDGPRYARRRDDDDRAPRGPRGGGFDEYGPRPYGGAPNAGGGANAGGGPSYQSTGQDSFSLNDGGGNIYNINLGNGNQAVAINDGDGDARAKAKGPGRGEDYDYPPQNAGKGKENAGKSKGKENASKGKDDGKWEGGPLSGVMDTPVLGSALQLCGGVLNGVGLGGLGTALYGKPKGKDSAY